MPAVGQVPEQRVPGSALDERDDRRGAPGPDYVGSGRGAVPGLLPVRFPDPPSAPDMRLSSHPALHGSPLLRRGWPMVSGYSSPASDTG